MIEEGVQGAADLPDLGAFVGEPLRYPLVEVDLPGGERQLGNPVGGPGHLSQRCQLTAYDECADEGRSGDAQQRGQQLEPHQVIDRGLGLGAGQTDDHLAAGHIGGQDSVRLNTMSFNDVPEVITLKLDPLYWPSYELVRDGYEWRRRALN